jgi:hypothetical protein
MTIAEVDSALGEPSGIDDDADGRMRSYWTWGRLDLFVWFDESGKLKGHYFAALNRERIRGFAFERKSLPAGRPW